MQNRLLQNQNLKIMNKEERTKKNFNQTNLYYLKKIHYKTF